MAHQTNLLNLILTQHHLLINNIYFQIEKTDNEAKTKMN